MITHFHSSDVRFCKTRTRPRLFSLNDDEVNCPQCLAAAVAAKHQAMIAEGRELFALVGREVADGRSQSRN